MVGRGELTDKAWEQIAPLLPENDRRGGRWRDHRQVINGILWKLRTGAPCGVTYRRGTVHGKPATTDSCAGGETAPGIGSWLTRRPSRMRSERSYGR